MERIDRFRKALSVPISQLDIAPMIEEIIYEPTAFADIYKLTSDQTQTVSWRALWVCEKLSEQHPAWFTSLQEELIENLLECTHDGSKRLYLSILYNLPVTDPLPVRLLNFCLDRMLSLQESIAVQALCIKNAYLLCRKEPELLNELRTILENAETDYFSTGVTSSIRNTLKKIDQIKTKK